MLPFSFTMKHSFIQLHQHNIKIVTRSFTQRVISSELSEESAVSYCRNSSGNVLKYITVPSPTTLVFYLIELTSRASWDLGLRILNLLLIVTTVFLFIECCLETVQLLGLLICRKTQIYVILCNSIVISWFDAVCHLFFIKIYMYVGYVPYSRPSTHANYAFHSPTVIRFRH